MGSETFPAWHGGFMNNERNGHHWSSGVLSRDVRPLIEEGINEYFDALDEPLSLAEAERNKRLTRTASKMQSE